MIIGDASDYIFGGMDKLLSKDWTFDAFVKRYIYVDPFEVLKEPESVQYVFERYRKGDDINFVEILERLATQESYGSYDNAFVTARLAYFDPYEKLKLPSPSNERRMLDSVMRMMALHSLPLTFSLNIKSAMMVVATISKFPSREALADVP